MIIRLFRAGVRFDTMDGLLRDPGEGSGSGGKNGELKFL